MHSLRLIIINGSGQGLKEIKVGTGLEAGVELSGCKGRKIAPKKGDMKMVWIVEHAQVVGRGNRELIGVCKYTATENSRIEQHGACQAHAHPLSDNHQQQWTWRRSAVVA